MGLYSYLYFIKNLKQLLSDWQRARKALEQTTDNLPRIIGTEVVKVVKQNFQVQGYDSGIGVKKWVKRAKKTDAAYDANRGPGGNSRYKGTVFSSTKPLLMQTKNLYNAVEYTASKRSVKIGVNLNLIPYAKIQNEGGRGIPARQYMPYDSQGPNIKMLRAIEKKVLYDRNRALRDFKK